MSIKLKHLFQMKAFLLRFKMLLHFILCFVIYLFGFKDMIVFHQNTN